MSVVRRFLVAPSLVRLLRKERGGSRISEGYFAPQGGRTSFVRIDGQHCHLVLVNAGSEEQRTEVPRAHGDALFDVCAGKALYDRTTVSLGGSGEVLVDRYTQPAGFDLASVAFETEAAAQAFAPPAWFGTEVTGDAAYERHAIALQGVPQAGETSLSNAALDAVLDLIEPRFGLGRPSAPPPRPAAPPAPKPSEAAAPAPKPPEPEPPAPPKAPEAVKPPEAVAAAPLAAALVETAVQAPETAERAGVVDALREMADRTAAEPETAAEAADTPASDTRIDDVIESLSQALGAAIQQPQEPAREDDLAASFERWTVRPRRTTQQG